MDVSENSGTPKSFILIGFSIINHPFWSTPIFGNIHILDMFSFTPFAFLRENHLSIFFTSDKLCWVESRLYRFEIEQKINLPEMANCRQRYAVKKVHELSMENFRRGDECHLLVHSGNLT